MNNFYKLKKDVFFVNGAYRGAIYDLNKERIYSIGNKMKINLLSLLSGNKLFNEHNKILISLLSLNQIIEDAASIEPVNDILSLKTTPKITFCWLKVTNKCNLKCSFCYENSGVTDEKITKEEFDLVLSNLINLEIKKLQFTGGEPLLHSGLKEMVVQSTKYFDVVEIYTNGTLIDENWCKFFKKNKIRVIISLHSYIPDEHDKITLVHGSQNKVINSIELLGKHDIPFRLAAVSVAGIKIGNIPENLKNKFTSKPLRVSGRGRFEQFDFELFKRKVITKDSFINQVKKEDIVKFIGVNQCFSKYICIDYNLNVYPCVMEKHFCHGNLKKESLIKLLKKSIIELSKDKIDICRDCEYRYVCYDCRADYCGQNNFSKPWYCTYDPYKGEWENLKLAYKKMRDQH
jgi:radical SAM protein with 4Fe4S-binding SPASM domain